MAKRRGRPAKYVLDRDGRPVVGLSFHKASGRYYATHAEGSVYFGSDYDLAISRFRAWESRRTGPAITLPGLTHRRDRSVLRAALVDVGWMTPEEASAKPAVVEVRTPSFEINEDAVWGWLREQIISDPRRAAQRLAIPEIAYLADLNPPEPSLRLTEAIAVYLDSKKQIGKHWRRKNHLFWREFVEQVGKITFGDVTAEDIERYHDFIWEKAASENRSPTWLNHRLSAVRTVLRYCMKKQKDLANLRRVLDLTEVFEHQKKASFDPRPIDRGDVHRLLAVCDEKWTAVFLLMLNACMYPGEVAQMRKDDVDLQKKTLVTRRPKTGVIRVAVLWERTIAAIEGYQSNEPHDSEFLFISEAGLPYSTNHMGRNFRRRRDKAGLPVTVTMDMFRDGAFTAAIQGGHNPIHADILAGHQSGMKDHYVRRNPQIVAHVCEVVEKAYF
jgi:integrase